MSEKQKKGQTGARTKNRARRLVLNKNLSPIHKLSGAATHQRNSGGRSQSGPRHGHCYPLNLLLASANSRVPPPKIGYSAKPCLELGLKAECALDHRRHSSSEAWYGAVEKKVRPAQREKFNKQHFKHSNF